MYCKFPEPFTFGWVNRAAVAAITSNGPSNLATVWSETLRNKQGNEAQPAFQAFGHLANDLKRALGSDEVFRLVSVDRSIRTAKPDEPFISVVRHRHADLPLNTRKKSKYYEALMQTTHATLYTCGTYDNPDSTSMPANNPSIEASVLEFDRIGIELDQLTDEELQKRYPGIYLMQPAAYAAHLLTYQHLHQSPINTSTSPVTREHYELLFESSSTAID